MTSRNSTPPDDENTTWFESSSSSPTAVVIIAHGLNQSPSTMDDWSHRLQAENFHVLRIALSGHGNDGARGVTTETWKNDVRQAFLNAQERFPDLPIHAIGYSLGGLAFTHALAFDPLFRPDKVVLLAPAISLRAVAFFARISYLIPGSELPIVSIAPRAYQRLKAIPLRWYENLLTLHDELNEAAPKAGRLPTTPVRVYASVHDELISLKGAREWAREMEVSDQWDLRVLEPARKKARFPYHLIVDERSLESTAWKSVTDEVVEFLRSK